MIGRAASCDRPMLCFARPAVSEAKRVGILEHGAGLEDAGAGFLDIGGVDALQPRDLLVLVCDQRRPVETDLRDPPAKAGGVIGLVGNIRPDHEQPFWRGAAGYPGAVL